MSETPIVDIAADRLVLHLQGFEGPLDMLLDLARHQKLDLATISILSLVDQFLAVVEGARRVRLELAADWLVMAAWLAWLKSRLLLPAGEEGAEEGEQAAEQLAARLRDLARVRQLAEWLGHQPQLGQEVFARGAPEDFTETDRSRFAVDIAGLLRALLAATRRGNVGTVYCPRPSNLWSVQQALERLAGMMGVAPGWTELRHFLPDNLASPLERRGAWASSLLAGLELARNGQIELRQEGLFAPIMINPTQRTERSA
jgi:segregation and condensation protein A